MRTTLWLGIAGATVMCVAEWAAVMLLAGPIVAAFGISHDGLADFTAFALRIWLLLLPFIGFQIVGSNYFQATGQPAKAIFLTLTRQIIFLVPLVMLLPDVLPSVVPALDGLDALYVAAPVSDFLAIFTVGVFLAWEMRRLRRMRATRTEAGA